MRITRRLLTGTITLLAAMALAAPTALGQAVELTDEATSAHCSAVSVSGQTVSGGCVTHLVSEGGVLFEAHIFTTVPLTTCDLEGELHLDEDGAGYIAEPALTGPDCEMRPCPETGQGDPWPVQLEETPGLLALDISACFDGIGDIDGIHVDCVLRMDVFGGETHAYEYVAPDEPCVGQQSFIEVHAHLIAEAGSQDFEVAHL